MSPLLKSVFHVQNVVFLKRDNFTDNDMIKDAILKYEPTLIFVEHDETFIEKVTTKKVQIDK